MVPNNDQQNGDTNLSPQVAAASFMSFLKRNGKSEGDLSWALGYQAEQARSGVQEITTPHQEAMEAWALQLAVERQAKEREQATLLKNP